VGLSQRDGVVMTSFDLPYTDGKTKAFWASQTMVPGEPIFVLIQDDSSDGKKSLCVTSGSLSWMKDQVDQLWNAPDGLDSMAIKVYALLPSETELSEYGISVRQADGKEILHLTKMLTPTHSISMWSCEL